MQKPEDIPQDIWDAAKAADEAANAAYGESVADPFIAVEEMDAASIAVIARAILDERKRCLAIMQTRVPGILGPNDWPNYVVGPWGAEGQKHE